MAPVGKRTNHEIRGLEPSVPPPLPPGREEGLQVEFIASGQRFHQSHVFNEALIQTPKDRVQRGSALVNMWRCGDSGTSGGNMETLCPFPTPAQGNSST